MVSVGAQMDRRSEGAAVTQVIAVEPPEARTCPAGVLPRGLASGESRAVAAFYRDHAAEVYRFIARMVNARAEDIEEILQDTMVAAVQAAGRFRGECSVRTWLCGIARHQVFQRQRTDSRMKRIPGAITCSLDAPVSQDSRTMIGETLAVPGDQAAQAEMREALLCILERLDDQQREALVLHYAEGFSVRDIARIWSKSERSVEGVLRRARDRAREIGAEYL